jgi:hypothetical protein
MIEAVEAVKWRASGVTTPNAGHVAAESLTWRNSRRIITRR